MLFPQSVWRAALSGLLLASCLALGAQVQANRPATWSPGTKEASRTLTFPVRMKQVVVGKKTYQVADLNDTSRVYRPQVDKERCFLVISKQEFRLYVYERVGSDTLLAAHYPICYARNEGPKTRTGDMCTPECSLGHPAIVCQIQDASAWQHDFKDGRGSFLAYGPWFMRLDLSKSDCHAGCRRTRSIGIHGSTGNEASVPGRDSEGCIRLRDADLQELKARFVKVGTRVVIKGADQGKLDFEKKAERKCKGYQCASPGYAGGL